MKRVIYKLIADYEKEERWINDMARTGLNLVDYTWGRYLFEEGRPGKYLYRIELLKHHPRTPQGEAYIRFMEEMGIECVATFRNWAYFRKKAEGEPFDLYSDYDSKIAHFTRVTSFAKVAFGANLAIGFCNVILPLALHGPDIAVINPIVGSINLVVAAVFLPVLVKYSGKLKKLKQDRQLRE